MSANGATPAASAELDALLAAHPEIGHVDALFIDLCGIARGKRLPRVDAAKLYRDGIQIPYSIYYLDVTGACRDPVGRGFSDGDPDGIARPLPGTLTPVGWGEPPSAQVLMTLCDADGRPAAVDPRNVAARALARLDELGLRPVVAFELEFYLLDPETGVDGAPRPARSPVTGERASGTQVYGFEDLDDFRPFFAALERECGLQGLPASVATAEYAPGQFEVNLRHQDDALAAADQCALFRHAVRNVARREGLRASFMGKPFPQRTGSGMHVHLSLLDAEGRNVFDDGSTTGGARLREAAAGLMETLPEAMAIFAPNLNGFRRLEPDQFVPVARSWGANNRSVAMRVPAGPGRDRRIEHRVASADANPYLVLAAIAAGMHHGLAHALDPGAEARGNAGRAADPGLPLDWGAAIEVMQRATVLPGYVGRDYLDLYCDTKRRERASFMRHVSPLEFRWYL